MLETNGNFESIQRLTKDMRKAAETLGRREVRFLVDRYYQVQDRRIRDAGQIRAEADDGQPHQLLTWMYNSDETLERDIKRALDAFTDVYTVGRWLKSICGIAEVISAGLMAHFEMEPWKCLVGMTPATRCSPRTKPELEKYLAVLDEPHDEDSLMTPEFVAAERKRTLAKMAQHAACGRQIMHTVGHFWAFAGLDPTKKWEKKTRRPWNAELKCLLAFKAGECFVKVQNNKKDFYGQLFVARKALEHERNERFQFKEQAEFILENKKIGKDTEAYKAYSIGKLPPAHIHARARRWAVKLFVAHLHRVMHLDWFGTEPPKPYIFEHGTGDHRHLVEAPNWPLPEPGKSLREMGE